MGHWAFRLCNNLEDIYYQGSVADWCNIGFDYNWNESWINLYMQGELIETLVIPEGVQSITGFKFYYCGSIKSVVIPLSVTSVGDRAFYCKNLVDIYYKGTAIDWAKISIYNSGNDYLKSANRYYYVETCPSGEGSFWSYDENGEIVVWWSEEDYTEGLIFTLSADETYYIVSGYNGTESNVVIPYRHEKKLVKEIGAEAFYQCTNVKSVSMQNSITAIGDYAFYCCSSLTSINIPSSVRTIGNYAFSSCQSATGYLTTSDTLTSIGVAAFSGCSSLSKITVGKNVTHIGAYAFSGTGSMAISFADTTTWYRVNSYSGWINRTGGTETSVSSEATAVLNFKYSYNDCYWYKK